MSLWANKQEQCKAISITHHRLDLLKADLRSIGKKQMKKVILSLPYKIKLDFRNLNIDDQNWISQLNVKIWWKILILVTKKLLILRWNEFYITSKLKLVFCVCVCKCHMCENCPMVQSSGLDAACRFILYLFWAVKLLFYSRISI